MTTQQNPTPHFTRWLDGDDLQQTTVELFVPGQPIAQGSKRHVGNGVIIESNHGPLKLWRNRVALSAGELIRGHTWQFDRPIAVDLTFVFPRLKNAPKHKPTKPKTSAPDIDKLIRAVFDALTSVLFNDDAQVVDVFARKRYAEIGEPAGVHILVTTAIP